jgi:hypothetical protein
MKLQPAMYVLLPMIDDARQRARAGILTFEEYMKVMETCLSWGW